MKKIEKKEELKRGEKYLMEVIYGKDESLYDLNNDVLLYVRSDFRATTTDEYPISLYKMEDFESIETPCLDQAIKDYQRFKSNGDLTEYGKKTLTEYKKIKSILQNVGKQVEFLEVGQEYEFSDDGEKWVKAEFAGYYDYEDCWHYIRPIQQSEEELKAIELLKNLGYKVEK